MKRFSYANVMATLAVVIALAGGTSAVAAVIITNNNQVAQNTISGHAPPAGMHANLISGSVNATDLSAQYTKSVTVHCPVGMKLGGGVCFEPTMRAGADWITAFHTCQAAGRALPTIGQLGIVYFNLTAANQTQQWTDGFFSNAGDLSAVVVDEGNRIPSANPILIGSVVPYRCVTTPTN